MRYLTNQEWKEVYGLIGKEFSLSAKSHLETLTNLCKWQGIDTTLEKPQKGLLTIIGAIHQLEKRISEFVGGNTVMEAVKSLLHEKQNTIQRLSDTKQSIHSGETVVEVETPSASSTALQFTNNKQRREMLFEYIASRNKE